MLVPNVEFTTRFSNLLPVIAALLITLFLWKTKSNLLIINV